MDLSASLEIKSSEDKLEIKVIVPQQHKLTPSTTLVVEQAVSLLSSLLDTSSFRRRPIEKPAGMDAILNSKSNASVFVEQYSYVFFIAQDASLQYLWLKGPEQGGQRQYNYATVKGAVAHDNAKFLTVVSYQKGDTYFIRLYFIKRNGSLTEYYTSFQDPDDFYKWEEGDLDSIGAKPELESPLASSVSVGKTGELKVYYREASGPGKKFQTAYFTLATKSWNNRTVFPTG